MASYRPILKAKPGEFEAVGTLNPTIAAAITPIFELCPDPDAAKAVKNALNKAKNYLLAGTTVSVDAGYLPLTVAGETVPARVARELGSAGLTVLPVVRPGDSAAALAAIGAAAAAHAGEAVLRIDVSAQSVAPALTATQVASLTAGVGMGTASMHLVLDCRALVDPVTAKATIVMIQLTNALGLGPWASVTVAAGAFPASISNLPVGTPSSLDRGDAALWRAVAAAGQVVDFGDYAINHPEMATGGRSPLPNLRYTADRDWLVWREQRARPGNESFYDLCKKVVAHGSYSGAGFSWGDAQIADKAAEVGGAGTATQWRAYGTSHHITTVVDRLATLGEP